MLSPKSSQIAAATGTFAQLQIDLWTPLLAGSTVYRRAFPNFEDFASKLTAVVSGSTQAKQLEATLVLIDRIGPVAASTTGTDGTYSTVENREGLLEYAMSVLFGPEFWSRMVWNVPVSSSVKNRAVLR